MKKIVQVQKIAPEGEVVINFRSLRTDLQDILMEKLPYNKILKTIKIINVRVLPSDLLARLTVQYLNGAEIHIENIVYKLDKPNVMYSYSFVAFDFYKAIPKSLAKYKFKYKGKETTYLDAMKSLQSRYIPTEIWSAVDQYSQDIINKVRNINRGDYEQAELWYKQLMHLGLKNNITVYSPNKKTFYEVLAERDFNKELVQRKSNPILNEEQIAYVERWSKVYGLEIPKFRYRIATRRTDHGFTQEPEFVYRSEDFDPRSVYDQRNNNNLPREQRQGLQVKELEDHKGIAETYKAIKWLEANGGDEHFVDVYHRCSECNDVYHEVDGCFCGHCKPIIQIRADNLLYGNSRTYEDYESTSRAYDMLEDEEGYSYSS